MKKKDKLNLAFVQKTYAELHKKYPTKIENHSPEEIQRMWNASRIRPFKNWPMSLLFRREISKTKTVQEPGES